MGGSQFVVVILLGLLIMWLLVLRPQRRRQAHHEQMLDSLRPGDEILTAGGLYGYVRMVDEDAVTMEVAPGTEVRIAKRAIAAVIPPDDGDHVGARHASPAPDEQASPDEVHAGRESPS